MFVLQPLSVFTVSSLLLFNTQVWFLFLGLEGAPCLRPWVDGVAVVPDCIPAQRQLSPSLWKFQIALDASHVFDLITPHRDVKVAEEVLSGFSVGALRGDFSISDPLRVYFSLFHLQLLNEHQSVIARSASQVLWVHPRLHDSAASGHEGDSGYVTVALMQAVPALNVSTAHLMF